MRISFVLVGRTMPGFTQLIDRVGKTFKAETGFEFMEFPQTGSFDDKRGQYDADLLISEIGRFFSPGEKTLFITREDLFSKPLNFVFGLAKGDSAIVSMARLDPRFYGPVDDARKASALFRERVLKESVHEIGHALGLPHCDDERCVMAFSNSIGDVDGKGADFCQGCRKPLHLD